MVRTMIEASLQSVPSSSEGRERQIAFYGGSFTALSEKDQVAYLQEVQDFLSSRQVDSIRLSTRPDALDDEILGRLKTYGVKTIEVGVQSMLDDLLLQSQRGHRVEDSVSAILRLKKWGFEIGVHLMMGLPEDSLESFLCSIDQIVKLRPDFVRIHPTLVLKGAPLEKLWREGRYSPLSLHETVQWLKKGVLKLEKASLTLARMGLQPTQELEEHLLAGPFHPALHQLVDSAIFYDMAEHLLMNQPNGSEAIFICHPKDLSNLRGQRNANTLKLKNRFNFSDIFFSSKPDIPRGRLLIQTPGGEESSIDRKTFAFFRD